MKISYTYLVVVMLCHLLACSKPEIDPDIPLLMDGDCEVIPNRGSGIYTKVTADTNYLGPDINPENGDQFIFIKYYSIPNTAGLGNKSRAELWLYDRGTKEYSRIMERTKRYPRWGPNDWIIFRRGTTSISKVKSNGDSLTHIAHRGDLSYPNWHPNGEWFVARILGLGRSNDFGIFDARTGEQVDSYPGKLHGHNPVWSNDGHRISAGHYIYDLRSQTSRMLTDSVNGPHLNKVWSPDDRYIFWVTNTRIFRTEVETGQTITLRDSCRSQGYGSLDIHPEGDHLLVTRHRISRLGDTDTTRYQVEIVQMDLDGTEVEVVFPPPGSLIKYN